MLGTALVNLVIVAVMFLAYRLPAAANVVVGLLLAGLCVSAFVRPVHAFFLLIGIKLTFDALWFLELSLPSMISRPLVVFLIPVVIVTLFGPPLPLGKPRRIALYAVLYLLWVVCAQAFGRGELDIEATARQAGMLIGLVLGFKYVRSRSDLDFLCLLVAVSTVLPVLMGLLQLAYPGLEVFYARADLAREYRPSGVYHDAGTSGTVYLMALACGSYLFFTPGTAERLKKYVVILLLSGMFLIVAGGTLSMLAAACCVLLVLATRSVGRLRVSLLLMTLIAVPFLGPYLLNQTTFLNAIKDKATVEFERLEEGVRTGEPLDNSQLFTGRMGYWQMAWAKFQAVGPARQLFGAGLSGSHSTYIHLLMQIGVVGLLFYLTLHGWIVFELLHIRDRHFGRTLAILSMVWMLLIGIALTTVLFSSFQWSAYMLVGAVLGMRDVGIMSKGCQVAPSPAAPTPHRPWAIAGVGLRRHPRRAE